MNRFLSFQLWSCTFLLGCCALPCYGGILITSGANANNRQNFNVATDQFLLDTGVFQINGPLVFANAPGGDPGLAGTALDNSNTFASNANFIVIRNFDNNDTNGFPANWDNSYNARTALQAIANNTDGNRPGFYMYWNERLGVNRLVYTPNLNDGLAPLSVLFAQNSANLTANTDDLQANTTFRAEANANFNQMSSFTAANITAVPEPSSLAFLAVPFGIAFVRRARARRRGKKLQAAQN
ncbi:MAG: hypothetical protein IT423_23510 [Pirellulaceae bacterium]|nr:hypothetical protein [Pirellulaceae bacterium]